MFLTAAFVIFFVPLDVIEEHCTTVYKVQEAFSAVSLPEGNVYGNALKKCLYG